MGRLFFCVYKKVGPHDLRRRAQVTTEGNTRSPYQKRGTNEPNTCRSARTHLFALLSGRSNRQATKEDLMTLY